MSKDQKNVVIFSSQFSVVVKGIESRLNKEGYLVQIIQKDVENYLEDTDVFILYLSDNIVDDLIEMGTMAETVKALKGKKLIFIGEKKDHFKFVSMVPGIKNYPWIDRPVDMDVLVVTLDKVIRSKTGITVNQRILIVDDDPAYAKMVREWLKETYQIGIVTAGMQALGYLLKNEVDLILLDFEMPNVDGPKVLEMLRTDPKTADIPVVFLTGIDDKESVGRVLELKPAGYVLKSTTRDALVKYLENLFAKISGE